MCSIGILDKKNCKYNNLKYHQFTYEYHHFTECNQCIFLFSFSELFNQERKDKAQNLKTEGNAEFHEGKFEAAISCYTEALMTCPLKCPKERSIMYSNRAACKLHLVSHTHLIKKVYITICKPVSNVKVSEILMSTFVV